jgi:uncharacterized lipoprotein YddW (UPF0748 family)
MRAPLLLLAATLQAQQPPAVAREFRAAWVATVGNIDWPSKQGLSTWEQQQELLAILNKTVALNMNAIVFHIRPGADALYASKYEPWSQFITGRQGRAPEPGWDPLAFAVTEAHKRGLELHAWFNPYRAAYTRDTAIAKTHIAKTNPSLVHAYDRFIWMDPGDPEVRRRTIRAIADVVRRYDVDGVHIDDYFYPYPVNDAQGKKVDFPDSATYARYRKTGGTLAKDDWRRHNVDLMVEAMFKATRAAKPWVKVGISPFGIWRPGNPAQIKGFDAYTEIYADSKKWLQAGWVDYFTPQLYWPIARPEQSYPVLLKWWVDANTKHRHMWPGLYTGRIADTTPARHYPVQEIIDQIRVTRETPGATGHVHFSMKTLMRDVDSLDEKLLATVYQEPALVPASPWLGPKKPGKPVVSVARDNATNEPMLRLTPARGEKPWLWTVRTRSGSTWRTEILPGWLTAHRLGYPEIEEVVVTAVSRTGVESAAAATIHR